MSTPHTPAQPPYLQSVIHHSKQGWKLLVFLAISLGGGIAALFYSFSLPPCSEAVYALLGGILTVFAGILVGAALIRCPSCGMHWMWDAVARRSYFRGARVMLSSRSCPQCGWSESDDAQ